MIKTFRGLLADGGQDRLRLGTIKGKVGYRIVKFQIMPNWLVYARTDADVIVQVWKQEQSTSTGGVVANLTQSDLLGVALWLGEAGFSEIDNIIFDNEIFNQDIYVTATDNDGSDSINYYLELEVITLTDQGAEYTTIKDIRTQKQ